MSRPLIGITCYVESASWAVWSEVRASLIPQTYIDQVVRAGGRPLIIPPLSSAPDTQESDDDFDRLLDTLDGLILSGGADIASTRYGQDPHPLVQTARHDRDSAEIALARVATSRDLPLLGVCRGMQVMAVAAGGQLDQHLPDTVGHDQHSPGPGIYGRHEVKMVAGTRLFDILGTSVEVASYHHQGVLSHPGYVPTGHSSDAAVEAMEDPGGRFRLGVQWHPEVDPDCRLFEALVAAARS